MHVRGLSPWAIVGALWDLVHEVLRVVVELPGMLMRWLSARRARRVLLVVFVVIVLVVISVAIGHVAARISSLIVTR